MKMAENETFPFMGETCSLVSHVISRCSQGKNFITYSFLSVVYYVSYCKVNIFMEMCFNNCTAVCNHGIKSSGLNNWCIGSCRC